jgi:NAD(P)-dependent dehydrogenase (short-subunit alcohol dehydrogenase family)
MAITFKDKVAIVTGGASGIGKSLSKLLAAKGCIVVAYEIYCKRWTSG